LRRQEGETRRGLKSTTHWTQIFINFIMCEICKYANIKIRSTI